jgi:hypothetical protein
MMVVTGIKVDGYHFAIEFDDDDIKRVYFVNGGLDVWPALNDRIRLKIFDSIFNPKTGAPYDD